MCVKISVCFLTGYKQTREGDVLHRSQVCFGYGREATLPGHSRRQGVLHHQVQHRAEYTDSDKLCYSVSE